MSASSCRISIEESLSLDGPPDAIVGIGGRHYQYYAGNGYYALHAHPAVLAATCEAVLRYGIGTATTRAAFTSPPIFEVQRKIAQTLETEHAHYCTSGYLANRILLSMLRGTYDRVFIDEASHCSLFEAIQSLKGIVSRAVVFAHRDVDDLKLQLDRNLKPGERPLLVSDGVFSTLGTIAPLDEYDALLHDYEGASVLIDDSQGFGVLGDYGRGTLEHFRYRPHLANRTFEDAGELEPDFFGESRSFHEQGMIPKSTPIRYYYSTSLSKAIGGYGGVIPGSESFVQRIIDHSKVFYGTTAPPPPIAAATCKALELVFGSGEMRNTLRRNTVDLKQRLAKHAIAIEFNAVPIIAFQVGSAHNMKRIQRTLSQQGILIAYLPRSPGVGAGGILRIAIFATHTPEMIETLAEALGKVL